MNHASLFSGIGGFDLAAEWCGWNNVFQVEIDPFCQKVLQKNFPLSAKYENIKEFNGTKYRGKVDIISGGFPCQPFSVAGKRKGTEDDRYLWEEMLRVVKEIKPRFVVGENVFGLVNWKNGLVFEKIISDLENLHYEVETVVIPACAVNAPHRRDRVWIIANTNSKRQQRREEITTRREREQCKKQFERFYHNNNRKDLPEPGISRGDDGFSQRMDRTKAAGNAIVPEVAYQIFKSL